MKKILFILPVVIIILLIGYLIPIKSVTIQGCPGADYTQRHNLILGDKLPGSDGYDSPMQECRPTIKHVLYLF
jgi:hypothetical protein